jgi:hypothetical protein
MSPQFNGGGQVVMGVQPQTPAWQVSTPVQTAHGFPSVPQAAFVSPG